MDQGQPLDPQRRRDLAQPQGPERPLGDYFGNVNFNNSGNPNSTSNSVADMLLGNFRTYEEASADPVGFFRFTTYQGFVSDTWRVRNNLSLEVGLRYEYTNPTYTQQNNVVNFDPSRYDPGPGGDGAAQRAAGARRRQPLQRPDHRRRRRPRGSAGARGLRRGRRLRPHSLRRAARSLRRAAPVHAALQLRVLAESVDGVPRRRRPVLRQARRQRDLLAAEHAAGAGQRRSTRTSTSRTRRAAPPERSARSARSTPSIRT